MSSGGAAREFELRETIDALLAERQVPEMEGRLESLGLDMTNARSAAEPRIALAMARLQDQIATARTEVLEQPEVAAPMGVLEFEVERAMERLDADMPSILARFEILARELGEIRGGP